MASLSSAVIETPKPTFDLSLCTSTVNRLDYLYEISHVPEDSKIPITDFPIVYHYTMFNKIPITDFPIGVYGVRRTNYFFYGFFEWMLGFIKHGIRIYNREVSNRNFTIFRYMRDFIQVV